MSTVEEISALARLRAILTVHVAEPEPYRDGIAALEVVQASLARAALSPVADTQQEQPQQEGQ